MHNANAIFQCSDTIRHYVCWTKKSFWKQCASFTNRTVAYKIISCITLPLS